MAKRFWDTAAAVFSALMAIALAGTWAVMLGTGQVPELTTKPLSTWSLLAAEFGTALLLVAGAYGLLTKRRWGRHVALAALGMLLYTTVNTVGVSAEADIYPAAVFMACVAIGSGLLIIWSWRDPEA